MTTWIPTTWMSRADVDALNPNPVEINLMASPFYAGIRYAVRRGSECLSLLGQWDCEPIPSERDDEWYRTHRFLTLAEAVDAANAVERNPT